MNAFRRFFGLDDGEEGQAVVLFAILMLALLFAVGLAIDAGQLYSAKRSEQEAADAAAFAGAVVLYQKGSGAEAIAAARTDALTNGYSSGGVCLPSTPGPCTDAATLTTVTVYWPPISGSFTGNATHIEVSITRQVKTSLVPAQAAFNPVRARGVAGAEALNNGYAIMALDPGNTLRGFWTGDNGRVSLNGGGILVNSTSSNAAENDANAPGEVVIESPYALDVTGQATGHWSDLTPPVPVNSGHAQVPDPFAGAPRPKVCGGPSCLPPAVPTPVYTSLPSAVDGVTTLEPGLYKVKIKGAGTDVFHMNPGIYILDQGMDTSGNGLVTGSEVFIFNTYSTYPTPPGLTVTCSDVSLTGNGDIDLSAITTEGNPYKNLLFYQDPLCSNAFEIGGQGNFSGTGSLYLPSALFMLDGNNATLTGSQLVARQVEIQQGNITINYDPNNTAQPILPRLAE
jgi:Flp pilus assembly protein TadG